MTTTGKIQLMMTWLLCVTAVLGSLGLFAEPPRDLLADTIFEGSPIPAIALLVVVGGSSLGAGVLTATKDPRGPEASIVAGMMLLCFMTVELFVIGSPAGAGRVLQAFYTSLGIAIVMTGLRGRAHAAAFH